MIFTQMRPMFQWLIPALLPGGMLAQDTLPRAVIKARQALATAKPQEKFLIGIDLARTYREAHMLDSARAVSERLLHDAQDDRERGRAHFSIARELYQLNDNSGVQEHARQAITLARAAKDTAGWIRAEGILVEVDMDLDRFGPARERDLAMLPIARATKDSAFLSNVHNNLGNLAYLAHHYDTAHAYYDTAIMWMTTGQKRDRLVMQLNQVNLYIEEERYDSAMARSNALRTVIGQADATLRAQYFNQRGYAQFSAEHYREAISEFMRSDSVNNAEARGLDLSIENTGFLAESYAAIGDSARAYLLMRDLEVLKDSLDRIATDERMLTLEKQFGTKLSKEEIKRLDGENKQKADSLRAKNVQLYGSLALVAFALGGILLVWRILRQKRRHAAVLEGLNTELKGQRDRIEEINRLLQLKVLRTQINPHFIYNCLHAIGNLVRKGDTVGAANYLDGFARLLRMVLDHSVKDRVPISGEMDFLRQYLKLESLRFENGLTWSVDADPALLEEDAPMPALLVQPFVENAIWHGLAPKVGEKRLSVRFSETDGKLVCTVEDNGVGRGGSPKQEHPDCSASLGLQLTNERLQLLTYRLEGSGRVTFTDLEREGRPAGTRVEVVLG